MNVILLVGTGGFLGAVARLKLGALVLHRAPDWKFPIATFLVNVGGCLIAGLLIGLGEKHDFLSSHLRLFLFTGFLGGFTTFSAFGVETVALLQRHEFAVAALYIVSSVFSGVAVLFAGMKLISS